MGQLDRIMFYESKSDGEFRPHMLPSDGRYYLCSTAVVAI